MTKLLRHRIQRQMDIKVSKFFMLVPACQEIVLVRAGVPKRVSSFTASPWVPRGPAVSAIANIVIC